MNARPAYTIDTSQYPIVSIQWHRDGTHEEFQGYLRDLTAIIDAKRRVTFLFHVPSHISFTTEERLIMSRWLRDHETDIGRFVLGTCFLTSSAMVGMALRAIFIFAPPKNAWKITGSQPEAEAWCRARQAGQAAAMAS